MVMDCNGYGRPMSYCAAVSELKALGFELEERGFREGKNFETWRLPEKLDTTKQDIDTRTSE
jgi:hypothetical protein